VSKDRSAPQTLPTWSRLFEWALLGVVVLALALVFARQVQVVKAQGELASLQSTLGALRTALVIDHLHKQVSADPAPGAPAQHNPFRLLAQSPPRYVGEMPTAQAALVPAGAWVFDTECVCVGYRPMDDDGFDSPSGQPMAWFALNGAPGPLQLTPREAYVWRDAPLR